MSQRHLRAAAALLALALILPSCAGVSFSRDTETSGTFRSWGFSGTIISIDLPKAAVDIARENVSDAAQPNTVVEEVFVFPYLGPLDWILDIVSLRYASVTGRWGYSEYPTGAE